MGMNTLDSPAIGGGIPFLYALYMQRGFHSSSTPQGQKGIKSGQNRAKVRFYLLALVFSRENRRPKGAKFKIYFSFGSCWAASVALSLGRWWCPLVHGAGPFGDSGPTRVPALVLWSCVPSLCPCLLSLCCFMLVVSLANMALFRILRGFSEGFSCSV